MAIDRANIRTRARIRADQDASTFPTDAQYNFIIDECGRTVYYDLIGAGFPFKETAANIVVSGFNEAYTLNSGNPIHSITGVFYRDSAGLRELKRLGRDMEAALVSQAGNTVPATHYLPVLDINAGPGISLFPGQTGGTYQVNYLPDWPGFANDADVWRGPARSDELIVLMAAAKGARKEGEVDDAKALEEEYRELWVRVVEQAAFFDRRNPDKMRDVNRSGVYDPFDYPINRDYPSW